MPSIYHGFHSGWAYCYEMLGYNKFGCCVVSLLLLGCLVLSLNSVQGNHAEDGKYFVFSNRKGCVTVLSQPPCPATQLNPVNAKHYRKGVREMEALMDAVRYANQGNTECITNFEKAHCSILTPKCFQDGSKDYGSGNAACWKANATCEHLLVTDFQDFCRSIPKVKQALPKCVLPSGYIEGHCPQPEYKVSLKIHGTVYNARQVVYFCEMNKKDWPSDESG